MQIKYWYFLSLAILIIDLLTKSLLEGINMTIIPNILSFISVHNFGASFGFLSGARWFFIVISVIFFVGMILFDIFYKRKFNANVWYKIGFTCILAGMLGNFIDRLFLGYVRDFISLDFINFPVFNIADIALTVGCISLVIFFLFFCGKEKKPKATTPPTNDTPPQPKESNKYAKNCADFDDLEENSAQNDKNLSKTPEENKGEE